MVLSKIIWSSFIGLSLNLSTSKIKTNENTTDITYHEVLNKIKIQKQQFIKSKASDETCKTYLLQQFEHSIFPYWKGRPWTYEGHTNTPYQGEIACGYFVSTTLKHMGFNWNRYHLAKLYSKAIVNTICDTSHVYRTSKELINYLNAQSDNLYILGLSNHVGLVIKHKGKTWFIHSNYENSIGPDQETISESFAIQNSSVFWIGKFLTKSNIYKWRHNIPYIVNQKK